MPKKILILGSGGLRIGQAGEFDYSGSQAIKALKEEGIKTVLHNPNIATVQTDASMADELYLYPLERSWVEKIIEKERPDAILLGFGGQTALNLGMELHDAGLLRRFGVRVLGTPVEAIKKTEDRDLFKRALTEIGVPTPNSIAVGAVPDALRAAKKIGYPVMMRSGYSLGGLGSGKISSESELRIRAGEALSGAPQILIEEYLAGWKEIEYEIVRDRADNCVTVCNMENMDPMGIHTGESIVVAPSQTLNNEEYHRLRATAIAVARHLGIVGECNIQYALHPKTSELRVIEVNARLSRSSALASKATGYPLAFVAAKLALGFRLDEIKNAVTGKTCAFFEPALDYMVVKIPRWDLTKFKTADRRIGTEMKSVGEVMGIGRSFPEALQKAVRMLNIGADGLSGYPSQIEDAGEEIANATDRRLFAIFQYLRAGHSADDVHALSGIDRWFLRHISAILACEKKLKKSGLSPALLRHAKEMGESDAAIARLAGLTAEDVRKKRIEGGILPAVKQVDTLAGEFPAETKYLYTTYHGSHHDVRAARESVLILGSGPYCIGSSVEFDWCAVNAARAFRARKKETVIINSNPETVSTDYDESDRLYFEELTEERVRDIADFERHPSIVVSVGGQIANTLALPLARAGYRILGTSADDIDRAENREIFSALLGSLGVDQPAWERVTTARNAAQFAERVEYPVLVRPSYVLSGAAMRVVRSHGELTEYIEHAAAVSPDRPVVISQFIENAKELEIDGVADRGTIVVDAIAEHVEHAGVHSGDATIVLPPQRLYLETIRRTKRIAKQIAAALSITGPFNIQFLAKDNDIKVIECNVRASRSFPFVSKVTGENLIEAAVAAFLGEKRASRSYETLELSRVGVKMPQFSYARLKGTDPVAHVEMASTGEVACISDDYLSAFLLSFLSAEGHIRGKRVLLSIGGDARREKFLPLFRALERDGWDIYATEGTHAILSKNGIGSTCLYKVSEALEPNVGTVIAGQGVDLIITIPRTGAPSRETDGYRIRRLAIDHHIPLVTNPQTAHALLQCLTETDPRRIPVSSWKEYIAAT